MRFLFESDEITAACQGCYPPDASNPDDIYSGPYFQTLDDITGKVWSQRTSCHAAGMYALGVAHTDSAMHRSLRSHVLHIVAALVPGDILNN